MDSRALIASLQDAFRERKGVTSLILQNHLYGCFIVMEDLAQGILEITEGHLTGNALYLNLETQFGQMGVRYYGFTMDGKAVLEDCPVGYKEAWMGLFQEAAKGKDMSEVDRVEEEVLSALDSGVDNAERYFMNALEYEGNLSPDWVERALYMLHPELVRSGRVWTGSSAEAKSNDKAGEPEEPEEPEDKGGVRICRKKGRKTGSGRGLSLTRRKSRSGSGSGNGVVARSLATTRRRTVREREPILLDVRE
jgi:hypothetical protein